MLVNLESNSKNKLIHRPVEKEMYIKAEIPNGEYTIQEDKLTVLSKGNYFGEKEILNNTKRLHSVYADTSVDLLYLDRSNFIAYFLKNITKSEYNKKIFIQRIFPFLKELSINRVEFVYNICMITRFFPKGSPLFIENNPCNKFYLILQGECELVKLKGKTNHDITTNSNLLYDKIILLEVGDITGLDSLRNYTLSPNELRYASKSAVNRFSCFSSSEYTVVLEIDIDKLSMDLKLEMFSVLWNIYRTQNSFLKRKLQKFQISKEKLKMNYSNKASELRLKDVPSISLEDLLKESKIESLKCKTTRNSLLMKNVKYRINLSEAKFEELVEKKNQKRNPSRNFDVEPICNQYINHKFSNINKPDGSSRGLNTVYSINEATMSRRDRNASVLANLGRSNSKKKSSIVRQNPINLKLAIAKNNELSLRNLSQSSSMVNTKSNEVPLNKYIWRSIRHYKPNSTYKSGIFELPMMSDLS